MTYSQFHFRFNVPLLAFTGAIACFAPWRASVWAAFLVILAIVVAFTTPWDNYAVSQGIWSFPGSRHAFRIWHLPIEEYCFFVSSLLVAQSHVILVPAMARILAVR